MRYKSLVKGSQEILTILQVDLLLHRLQTQFQFTIFSCQTISISLLRRKKKTQDKHTYQSFSLYKLNTFHMGIKYNTHRLLLMEYTINSRKISQKHSYDRNRSLTILMTMVTSYNLPAIMSIEQTMRLLQFVMSVLYVQAQLCIASSFPSTLQLTAYLPRFYHIAESL